MNNTTNPLNNTFFSKTLFPFHILFFFFFLNLSLIAQGTDWANGIQTSYSSCGGTSNANCYTFTISNIPYNIARHDTMGYSCFVNYNDGSYEPPFSISPGVHQFSFNYEFLSSGPKEIILQMAKQYDDDDEPTLIVIDTITTTGNNNLPSLEENILDLKVSLFPRIGDTVIYAITYRHECPTDITGSIFFEFDSNKVSLLNELSTNGFQSLNAGLHQFKYSKYPNTKQGISYAKLAFKDPGVEFENIEFKLRMSDDSGTCFVDTIEEVFLLDTVKSHDPNLIMADRNYVCTGPNDSMIYTIIFQNIGDGPARYVQIKDILPNCFLFSNNPVRTIKPENLNPIINESTREIIWEKKTWNSTLKTFSSEHLLRGTGEQGYKNKLISENDTKDSIVFVVYFDNNYKLPPCGTIVNRAEIIFDNNSPIETNDFYIEIRCNDQCALCDAAPKPIKLPAMVFDSINPVQLSHQGLDAEHYIWYPSLGLDNPRSASPKASPNKNELYTLVCSGGCKREIYQIPVIYDPKAVQSTVPPFCYVCCGLLLLPLLFLLKLKGKAVTFWDFSKFKKTKHH